MECCPFRADHGKQSCSFFLLIFQTVAKLNPKTPVFSLEALFAEFKSKLMFGFLEGICLFSTVYESQMRKLEDEERENPDMDEATIAGLRPRYADYRDAVVAMVEDVVRIKLRHEQNEDKDKEKKGKEKNGGK